MVTKTVDIHEFEKHLSELLALAKSGTEIIITQNDVPSARLMPLDRSERIPDLQLGSIWESDDAYDPLPDSFWLGDEE